MEVTSSANEQAVRVQHLAALYRMMPRPLPFYPLGGMLLMLTLWDSQSRPTLLAWLAAVIFVTIVRAFAIERFNRRPADSDTPQSTTLWERVAVISTGTSGLLLGTSAFLFLDPADPVSILIIAGLIMGAISGALASLPAYPPSYWVFSVTATEPLLIMLVMTGELTNMIIALLCLTLQFNTAVTCRSMFESMDTALRMAEKNRILLQREAQANAAKTRFLAAASHDLRQPLHALGLYFAVLGERVSSPASAPLLGQIDTALGSVGGMLTSILDISKLDAGIVEPALETVDLGALFKRLETEYRPIAAENGNRLRVRPSALRVRTDPALFERMLRNLVANAARHTHDGSILLATRRRGDAVRCEVHDTGPGIDPDQREAIFEEFYQIDNPARDRRKGVGLGLAIVRRHANLLGHGLELRSRVGSGSSFMVTLPATVPEERVTPIAAPQAARDPLQGVRVLLIDDDPIVFTAMSAVLEHWGCVVISANGLHVALALLGSSAAPPDILLVDYRSSDGSNGAEAIEVLRRHLGDAVPAAIITGDTAPDRLREAAQVGCPILHKPVAPATLRENLIELLERRGP